MKKWTTLVVLLAVLLGAGAWWFFRPAKIPGNLIHGNGRIEATEIDIATRVSGRVQEILVNEGDFVEKGQVLARIQVQSLEAQLLEAEAQYRQAMSAVATAEAQVIARESDKLAAEAAVAQRESELAAANQRQARSDKLTSTGAVSTQTAEDDRANAKSAAAATSAAKAQVAAAGAAITLELPAQGTVGLIGPDGVGKSSLLSLLAGARAIQDGAVTVLGGDMRNKHHRDAVCPRIAYMPQGLGKNLYPTLSVEENLQFFGRLFGHNRQERRQRIDTLTTSTGLRDFLTRPAGKLSGGMKQKARAVLCAHSRPGPADLG